jgi:hypothetical protein
MRTTVKFSNDVLSILKRESARCNLPMQEIANDLIRIGYRKKRGRVKTASQVAQVNPLASLPTRSLGLRPKISIDNIAEVLEKIEEQKPR